MSAKTFEWERLVVFYNPDSSNAASGQEETRKLEQAYPGRVITLMAQATDKANRTMFRRELRPGDVLIINGGDGTANHVARSLPTAPRVPILPLGTGNANDLAAMLYDDHVGEVQYILEHATTMSIHPLICTISPEQGAPARHLAVCYLSFGSTALGAAYLNQPDTRAKYPKYIPGGKLLSDIDTILHTTRHAKPFNITYHGQPQEIMDIIVANGPRMARTLQFPSRLERYDMFIAVVKDKHPLHVVQGAVDMMRGEFPGEHLTDKAIKITIHTPTKGQVDGESIEFKTPCTINIKHRSASLYALAVS